MKKLLNISIFGNLGLLGVAIFLLTDRRKAVSPVATFTSANIAEATALASTPPPAAPGLLPGVKPEAFRWSQLESADYQIYISNLRGIGCPEPTIRDIITADVDASVYAPRREQLQQKKMGGAVTAALAQHALETGLKELQKEEVAMIETLLGTQPPVTQGLADAPISARSLRNQPKDVPVAMPLVFQTVDLAALNLGTNRLNLIASLRQKFLSEIGGPDQDPNDPAYRERWQRAQADANNRLEAMIGMRAYQAYQFKAQSAVLSQAGDGGVKP